MSSQQRFLRGLGILAAVALVIFLAEFLLEMYRLSQPGAEAPVLGKWPDILSPTARAYNNILAMLVATIALAIPLTANIYTAKLIEMFLRDRINQFMLFFWALLAAHSIWILFLAGRQIPPMWAIQLTLFGAIAGWIVLIPYFFYIVRFVDPTNILARLKQDIFRALDAAATGRVDCAAAQGLLHDRLHQIGTIILKTIDRAERSVTLEGIHTLEGVLAYYGEQKRKMPAKWFLLQRRDFVGLSTEALALLEEEKTWVEHRVLTHVFLAYQAALAKSQDVISSLSETTRSVALTSAMAGDDKALELAVKFFNNYLREAIKRKDLHAIYDLFYQYRLLADSLWERAALLRKIGGYFQFYSGLAEASGLGFVPQIVATDLGWIVRQALANNSPAGRDLLTDFLALKHRAGADDRLQVVKAKAILGGYLTERKLVDEAARVRDNLADVSADKLGAIEHELLALEDRSFWEVTDRQVMFEWVPPEERPYVKAFLDSVRTAPRQTPVRDKG